MLYLPRAAVVSAAAVPERRQLDVRGAREIVLVVEDDRLVRSYVLTQIESLGYTTLWPIMGTKPLPCSTAARRSICCSPTSSCRAR
ncbi:hypothetical protein, partial [Bradyrhizobium brasilense]|uniref:hypothetical protein n=1 Tax=Bradyrhizobium brasilense TaxID=1419277 RepID=UPI003B968A93